MSEQDTRDQLADLGIRFGGGTSDGHRIPDTVEKCEERERDLRDALLDAAAFHVAHDGSVRHPDTCNDCRALNERARPAETAR